MVVATLAMTVAAMGIGGSTVAAAAAKAAAAPAPARSPQVMTTSEVHHDTSAPLRSIAPSGSPSHAHPALHSQSAQSTGVAAPDTSGSRLAPTVRIPTTAVNFTGIGANGSAPPDNDGAIGATQYVELVNSQFAVYSKSGATVLAARATNTLWSGFGGGCQTNNDGDGTVGFDTIAQRWVIQQFSVTTQPYLECIAVSTSNDATGTWNRYAFQTTNQDSSGNGFPDYPKLGIWPDGYYVSYNLFNAAGNLGQGTLLCAYDRTAMVSGAAATQQCILGTTAAEKTALPATVDGTRVPPAGAPEWFVGISPTTANALAYYKFHVDFTTPANSSVTGPTDLPVQAFSNACGTTGTCIPQSGTTQQLDSLGDRLMYRLAYRNFGDHEALVVTHSITAGTSVGERWYELRPSAGALTVFQQGTYAPDATYRWMGSIAQDSAGDMALGYSISSSSLHPGIAYTGRLATDAAGQMPQGEATLFAGPGSQTPTLSRWGDYSEMTVDPVDDCTFWYVNEYLPANGTFNWATRIGSFKFPNCGATQANDFSMAASPASVSAVQGQSATSTISTTLVSGSAQSISLSASGLPSAASASFNPASVSSGGSSTLTITTAATTPAGTYNVTVTGTGTSATHTTAVSLTVTSSGGGTVVTNGGFEAGSFAGWTASGASETVVSPGHSGTYSARLGATTATNGNSSMQQTITVPSNATLSFWYQPHCPDTLTYDQEQMQVRSTSNAVLLTVLNVCSNSGVWTQVTQSLAAYASQTVVLWFNSHDDNYASDPTYTLFDDVSVTSTAPVNDFSISANPSSVSVVQGQSATSTISTAVTSGSAQTVSLSVSGLPTGAGASFNPTSVTAGGSSILTITTAAATPPGTSTVTVTGTGTSKTHSATLSLTVTSSSGTVVTNGGFETGTLAGWTTGGVFSPVVSTTQKHTGSYSAKLGASTTPEPSGDSSLIQTIAVPTGSSSLNFYYWPASADTITYDWQEAQIRSTSSTLLAQVFKVASNTQTWTAVTFDLTPYAGTTVQLYFNVRGDGAGDLTYMYLDDVAVNASTPPPALTQVSSDPYTNTTSQHATEVEPDSLSNGSTIVSAFQVGRFNDGGANDTGWATSTNGGQTWSHGYLPGITTSQGGGTWARVSDPAVAWDAKHGVWLISGLALDTSVTGRAVTVNRSTDGVTWSNATNAVTTTTGSLDKDWIVCDTTATSPSYGNCYIEYDDNGNANLVQMLTSTDGGLTWSAPRQTADAAHGLGGQPLVQTNGTVVVPYLNDSTNQIRSFVSTNGGTTWGASVLVSSVTTHTAAAGLRTSALPTAEIDAAGTVYTAWQDCRFRSGCPADDIVFTTSTNGTTWSAIQRVPIDAVTSTVDHFIPGLAVDRATSGATAHLGLYYYYYPTAACSSPCQLDVGFVSSANGGTTWSAPTQVAGPMSTALIAPTTQGAMVGDYISASFSGGRATAVFSVGVTPSGSAFNEGMYTLAGGLLARGGTRRSERWTGLTTPVGGAQPSRAPVTAF